ncbi:hypothetical protein [Massilia scottii]|uniref:hypothetical protein n=1 Tax=Massilia scottii TaxID=3057166 RepID=UPI002796D708|nr:hypothetical protein [Massilia sp. CCM 9029]MDQ1834511.1 hypothetical protein [Massilia sp. CCM 9029]
MRQKIKLTIVAIVLSTAALACAILFTDRQELGHDARPDTRHAGAVKPFTKNAYDKLQQNTSEKLQNSSGVLCLRPFSTSVAVTPDDAKIVARIKAAAAKKQDLATLAQFAKQGDSSAALVLFQKVRPCSETTRHMDSMEFEIADTDYLSARECTQLPASLLRNPIEILLPAAETASIEAKLLISKNAPTVAAVMAILGNASEQERSNLRTIAERHALDAARAGSETAMAWLAHSYLSGTFGRKDAPSAYAITQAWTRSESTENRHRVGYLHSQLSRAELDTAKSLLSQCSVKHESDYSIMLSPFN